MGSGLKRGEVLCVFPKGVGENRGMQCFLWNTRIIKYYKILTAVKEPAGSPSD